LIFRLWKFSKRKIVFLCLFVKNASRFEQVGVKDAMVNEINEKFPHNPDNRSPQFEIAEIINVIRQMKNSSSYVFFKC